ncbi:GTPase [Neobacillus sp. 114]|uniref:GTPase n=1 Tax=Neobacillus sp. 114 TaxID=3048535 RepID=UPI0024C3621C|nr:GTPase [Neobacillus sp. 114]
MQSEYVNYFLSHLIVADEKIDEQQLLFFRDLLDLLDLSESEEKEMDKILSNDDDKKSFDEIVEKLKGENQRKWQEVALEAGAAIAVCTGYLYDEGPLLLDKARELWGISQERYEELKSNVYELISLATQKSSNKRKMYSGTLADTNLFKITDVIQKWYSESGSHRMEQLNDQTMLNGRGEYKNAIEYCKAIAKEDFAYASPILDEHLQTLLEVSRLIHAILPNIGEKETDEFNVKQTITDLEQQISKIIDVQLKEVSRSLKKKKQAMNYFTISFMGKTKAGKSTLHAVITGRGKDAIGVGKQRTTRYNRIYTWRNIRIIDTPGIGAPGGKSDEEIAKSIIDESDVICYLVKNDSVQPAEFKFLKGIKEKNKPIVILLNVKENLDHPAKLKRFLAEPEFIYERKDAKSLDGHINRIRRYAEEHYQNSTFDIIPVQLYAALLSKKESFSKEEQRKLYDGSHIEKFLNALQLSVIEDGHIRRSQTILDGLIYPVHETNCIFQQNMEALQSMLNKLKRFKTANHKKLKEIGESYQKRIGQTVDQEFAKLEDKISPFATNNYHRKQAELEREWSKVVQSVGLEKSLESKLDGIFSSYASDIEQHLKELVEDLSYTGQRLNRGFDVNLPNLFDAKRFFAYFAGIGGILVLFSGPIGWIGWGIVAVGTVLGFFFKSKKKKIQEVIDKLTKGLTGSVTRQKLEVKSSTIKQFQKKHGELFSTIDAYQNTLISSLEKIIYVLSGAQAMVQHQEMKLNKAYAYRLLFAQEPRHRDLVPLNDKEINKWVTDVERTFGKRFFIQTPKIIDREFQEALAQKIQEHVIIESISRERVEVH